MILNITEAANLALHSLVYLANNQGDWPISAARTAAPFGASEAHLNKVFQRLNKAGLVGSVRGPRGGFVLARDAEEITLLEIFEAIDGPLPRGHCLLGKEACTFGSCIFGGLLPAIHGMVSDHFSGTTLADLMAESGKS
jgi:Rrf2 family protein